MPIDNLLQKLALTVANVDLFEVNEAFSVVTMAAMKHLKHSAREDERPRRGGRPGPSDRGQRARGCW